MCPVSPHQSLPLSGEELEECIKHSTFEHCVFRATKYIHQGSISNGKGLRGTLHSVKRTYIFACLCVHLFLFLKASQYSYIYIHFHTQRKSMCILQSLKGSWEDAFLCFNIICVLFYNFLMLILFSVNIAFFSNATIVTTVFPLKLNAQCHVYIASSLVHLPKFILSIAFQASRNMSLMWPKPTFKYFV